MKERIFGIRINDQMKVYRLSLFEKGEGVIYDFFNGTELVIVGRKDQNFIVGFESATENGEKLNLTKTNRELPAILEDNEGNVWEEYCIPCNF